MTTLLEDLRLALRQICGAIGLSNTAATVIPLVVLGVGMNVAALSVMKSMRNASRPGHHQIRTALQTAAHDEFKLAKAVWISSLKTIGAGPHRWCVMQQRRVDRQPKTTGYDVKVGVEWGGPGNRGCDVTPIDGPARKIAFVAC